MSLASVQNNFTLWSTWVKNNRLKTVNTNITKWLICTAEYGDMFHIAVEQGKLWPFIMFFTILICSGHIQLALHFHITPCFSCVNIIKLSCLSLSCIFTYQSINTVAKYLPVDTGWMDGWMDGTFSQPVSVTVRMTVHVPSQPFP